MRLGTVATENLVCPDYPDTSTCYVEDAGIVPGPDNQAQATVQFPYVVAEEQPEIINGVPVFRATATGQAEQMELPCLMGSGPLRPGQQYCANSDPRTSTGLPPKPSSIPWWVWLLAGAGVLLAVKNR